MVKLGLHEGLEVGIPVISVAHNFSRNADRIEVYFCPPSLQIRTGTKS